MNDPNKVINVNLSSLLSLKAELLRKQAEVSKAKVQQQQSSSAATIGGQNEEYTAHKSNKYQELDSDDENVSHKKRDKKKRVKEVKKLEDASVYEHEDSAMLEKSQKVLEAKAKFYERMTKSGGKLNSDDNCLVMFNKKRQEEVVEDVNAYKESDDSASSTDDDEPADDSDDDWVEFTDCLGRSRKCLKRDLEESKRRDKELAESMPERLDQTKANWMIDTMGSRTNVADDVNADDDDVIGPLPPASYFGDGCSMMSKHEEQKANWERKEQENLDKTDVHYQDVFFDEARQHGVGYYAFSTDEAERKKQQKELEKARQKTLEEQQRRENIRSERERIIAERVLAAKNRQRARLGLPALEKADEDEENKKADQEEEIKETKEERKARKKAEKLQKKLAKEAEEREKERQEHIRPWDMEKDEVAKRNVKGSNNNDEDKEWQYRPEKEPMTQDQWNESKRKERISEFAPVPENVPLKRTNFSNQSTNFYNNVPPPMHSLSRDSSFNTFQTTRPEKKSFKRRNYNETTAPQSNDGDEYSSSNEKQGVCIPPPSNLEDFLLPSQKKKPKTTQELETSIEAGLRFLRNNCDKQMPATKSSWTSKADY